MQTSLDGHRPKRWFNGVFDRLQVESTQVRLALALLILMPLIVKAPLILGVLISDPLLLWGGVSEKIASLSSGTPTIDPNIAYTSHALGTAAARLLADGQSLWWNPYEGVGAPLAGEMQSAAMFPLTWLMLFPAGQLAEHIVFQIIAGVATFCLLRRLAAQPLGAWLGGTAFAFNGVFAWLANAVINPVCFLPVLLLGVETLRSPAPRDVAVGGLLVTGGLAASLYAGFPEVAYLNGLLVAAWTMARTATDWRAAGLRYPLRVLPFGLSGLLLTAPLLIAFFGFLQVAHVGIHDGTVAEWAISGRYATMLLLPYYAGFLFRDEMVFWGNVGGYAGFALSALALAGAAGGRDRTLRLVLSSWVVLCLAGMFGVKPLATLIGLVPGVKLIAFYRYIDASMLMALVILAGLSIDDIAAGRMSLRTLQRAALAMLVVTAVLVAVTVSQGIYPEKAMWLAPTLCQLAIVGAFLACLFYRGFRSPSLRLVALAAVGVAEMTLLFAIPLASYPYRGRVELSGIEFLRRNLGLQRFVSLGPIQPNYGSFFGLAQVNHNDLPVPQAWADYTKRRLDPKADPIVFIPSSPRQLLASLPEYAAIGTRFAVTAPDVRLPGLAMVHADPVMRIWEIPRPSPYATADGCAVTVTSRTEIATRCGQSSRLTRLELFMPGWTATVNGRRLVPSTAGSVFQTVPLPAGAARVHFVFEPPWVRWGYGLAALGLMLFALMLWHGTTARPRLSRRGEAA